MWTKHHKKRKLGRFVMPLITVAFLSYFGYHSIHGDYRPEGDREVRPPAHRAPGAIWLSSTTQRETLEKEVALLSDGSLERDMLDEKARFG